MARLIRLMARISLVLLLFAAILSAQKTGSNRLDPRAQEPAREFTIDSIAIEGNRILTGKAIIAATGLKIGAIGTGAIFDAARDRLLASGYFDTVSYRYKASATGGYDLSIDVREITQQYPFRVEALPVSTAETAQYLKANDPLFTGRLPGTQLALTRVTGEIEALLASKNAPAQVLGRVIASGPEQFEIDFTPPGGLPPVASVTFEGNQLINALMLQNKTAEVAYGQPYTEAGFRVLLENQIRPLYESKGHLRVTFPKVTAAPSASVKGMDVKVTIDEGPEYKLSRVAVAGRSASESLRILKTAKIPQMTIANFDELKQAAVRVRDSLKQQGYLDAEVNTDRKVDDEKKTAEFFLVVDTGPEYTFRTLTVEGLGLDGEAAIRKMWSVKEGDAFPSNYPDYFLSRVKEEGLFDNLGTTKATPKIDLEAHVVDVTLDFKGMSAADSTPRKPGAPGTPGGQRQGR
jgi:outer membrane protein assembly factor BamA